MDIVEQLKASNPMITIAVVGVVALFLAIKLGHAILRLVLGLIVPIPGAVGHRFQFLSDSVPISAGHCSDSYRTVFRADTGQF